MRTKRFGNLSAGLLFTVFFILTVIASHGETAMAGSKVFRWRAQHFLPSQMEGYKEFARWCDKVKAASNGRLVIKPFPTGAAVTGAELWEAVRNVLMLFIISLS